jgi:tRNA (cytidine/uridine-2'-O-)-methyltransferase
VFHVALYEPEIPANTGNVGRLCVATGATLHLVGQPGFRLDDRAVRRAGVDHWAEVRLVRHATLADLERAFGTDRIFCFSTRGQVRYTELRYRAGDVLLFGPESRGLPEEVLQRHAGRTAVIPMPGSTARSLNLANAVSIALYEALRQACGW